MRAATQAFIAANDKLTKAPCYVLVASFDIANTDLVYITTGPHCALPSAATAANTYHGYLSLSNGVVRSQTLDPIEANSQIGGMSVSITDIGANISGLLNTKDAAGKSLRKKRAQLYGGYKGLAFSQYQLIQEYLFDKSLSFVTDGSYAVQCSDLQRETRKNVFDVKKTVLVASISATDTTITVQTTSPFEMIAHGTSYSDAPSATVGYIIIEKEVIRYTGKTSTTFTGCVRGALNTQAVAHTVDTDADEDRRTKVEEHIYIEEPAIDVIKKTTLGTGWPDHWNLGVDPVHFATSQFNDIGVDIYDSTDPTKGKILYFDGLKKVDGKKWLETECYLAIGCFPRILNDGQIGIKRFANITPYSAYVRVLDDSNTIPVSRLDYAWDKVYNNIRIFWNYERTKKEYTRNIPLTDQASIDQFEAGNEEKVFRFKGINGRKATDSTIRNLFAFIHNRHSGPPLMLTVDTFFSNNRLEVGDVVRVKLAHVRDYQDKITSIDRSFEVQQATVNWARGTVQLKLFGAYQEAKSISYASAFVLNDSFYSSAGTDITTVTTGAWTAGVGSTWQITSNSSLTGATTMSAGRYYCAGDLEIAAGVTLSISHNVELRVKGNFNRLGAIDGAAAGLDGAAKGTENPGTQGYIGSTLPGGGVALVGTANAYYVSYQPDGVAPLNESAPLLDIVNTDGTALEGLPEDMRGASGGAGGNYAITDEDLNVVFHRADGGKGGKGGASLRVICRSESSGVNASIDLSGGAGDAGDFYYEDTGITNHKVYGGGGAPGYSGVYHVCIDGNSITVPTFDELTANTQTVSMSGKRLSNANVPYVNLPYITQLSSHYQGEQQILNRNQANFVLQYLPVALTPQADAAEVAALPTAFGFTEVPTNDTVAQNLVNLEVTLTHPTDDNYSHSKILWKRSDQSAYYDLGTIAPTEEFVKALATDGVQYDFIAKSVSIYDEESDAVLTDSHTMATASQGANLATGNYIGVGMSAYNTGAGAWIEKTASGVKASFGNSAGNKILIDNDASSIVDITGKITADEGEVGGFTIGPTQIYSGPNHVVVDSSNKYIAINSATFGASGIQLQYNSGSPQLYVGDGSTKYFKYTSAGVEVGGGTLKETLYEIYTSGLIRNDAAPSTNGGFQLDNSYLRTWNTSGVQTYNLDFSDGSFLAGIEANNAFIKFDATAETLTIGPEVVINSAESFNSNNTFVGGRLIDFEYYSFLTSSGTVTKQRLQGRVDIACPTSLDGATVAVGIEDGFENITFAKDRSFKTRLKLTSGGGDVKFGTGAAATGSNTIHFKYNSSTGDLEGITDDGTSTTTTTLVSSFSTGSYNTFDFVFEAGVNVKFYVDGVLKETVTTDLPSSASQATQFAFWTNAYVSSAITMQVTSFRVNQLP